MDFPVYIGLGPWRIHPHLLFEALGYSVAFQLILSSRRVDVLDRSQRLSVMAGGLVGALLGAKGLALIQHLDLIAAGGVQALLQALEGKTVVGALLGGVLGVELTKKLLGVRQATGDVFVLPLIAGMAIGRLGCFLTGLSDRTYGIATDLPWGVDFGDGLARHPTQLYEVLFLGLLALALQVLGRRPQRNGLVFQIFLAAYLLFRFLVDFLKPEFHPLPGLSAIQIACLLALVLYCRPRLKRLSGPSS